MPRVVSTGELRKMLTRHAELPESGIGVSYIRLPPTISRDAYEHLDAASQSYYVPGEALNGGKPLTYELPPGSYEAWLVKP